MDETRWTASLVEGRLAEAAEVLSRLPEERVQGYFNAWPEVVRSYWEAFARNEPTLRRPWPSPAAITRMEETFLWLRWLEPDDARLVWDRADGAPWKVICWRFGKSRATAWRHWVAALAVIAEQLNRTERQRLIAS